MDRVHEEWYSSQDHSEASVSLRRHTVPHKVLKKWLAHDKRVWKRTLLALETAVKRSYLADRGGHLVNEEPEHLVEDVVRFEECEYLPQLIVSGCKCRQCHLRSHFPLTTLGMPDLQSQCLLFIDYLLSRPDDLEPFDITDWTVLSYDDHSRIAFCFASQYLSNSEKHKQLSDHSNMNELAREKIAGQLSLHAKLIEENLMDDFSRGLYLRPLLEQALCFKAVGIMAESARVTRSPIAFPLLDRLPLVDLGVQPPVPYYRTCLGEHLSWTGWLRRYNTAASQESSLKGEWVGVFSEGMIIHPMTENIHFRPTSHDELFADGHLAGNPEMSSFSADNCIDPVGKFSVKAQLDLSGRFYAEKSYLRHSQLRWFLQGAMTPFGIVGQWWPHDAPDHGLFWFYKRAWCTPSTETFRDLPTSNIAIDPYPEDVPLSDDDLEDFELDDLDSFDEGLDEEGSDSGSSDGEEWITEDSRDQESGHDDNNQDGSRE